MDHKKVRVIVVEDQVILRNELIAGLQAEGVDASGVSEGASLYIELLQRPADIVVMDIGLPGQNGIEIVRQLKSVQSLHSLGFIMLTGHAALNCRLESLASGADVFLVKPVELDELIAYIYSLYRRIHPGNDSSGSLTWQFHQREWRLICPSGDSVELSHLEASFMEIVVKNAGKPVRRRDIVSIAFGQDPIEYDYRRLEAIVSRLRRKIQRQYPFSQPIRVVHSIGYIFTDSIRCV